MVRMESIHTFPNHFTEEYTNSGLYPEIIAGEVGRFGEELGRGGGQAEVGPGERDCGARIRGKGIQVISLFEFDPKFKFSCST